MSGKLASRFWVRGVLAVASIVVLAGCSNVVPGQATSSLFDPFHVAGLPAEDGPSGLKDDAPEPTGEVENTDGGDVDRMATLAVNDVAEYWEKEYSVDFKGKFTPIERIASYDSTDPASPKICGRPTYQLVNAYFCPSADAMAWDRGVLVPTGMKFFGDASVAALLAHEYGHAVQHMAGLVDDDTPVVVLEQQADCFAGSYLRWVAEGDSPRFRLSTGDGLNKVLAAAITLRDPILGPQDSDMIEQGHGTALDRISAFQIGFTTGAKRCGDIDFDDVQNRRAELPMELQADTSGLVQTGEVPIDKATLSTLMEVLGVLFSPAQAPTLSYDQPDCPDSAPSPPASYCSSNNTIYVDLPGLQTMGAAQDESSDVLIQGDNTALSVVTSRYMQAVQHERGLSLQSGTAALRTACLTGVAQRGMSQKVDVPSGEQLVLTAGDLDEAVAGLLTNGLAASAPDGSTVPAGFTRIVAYRAGLTGDTDGCFQRFP